ncbi:MAG TPA: hypothetical protein VM639_23340 [Dongiaceae bacterium]|nr:hypothetical protein [Dongiaceae bacterium]
MNKATEIPCRPGWLEPSLLLNSQRRPANPVSDFSGRLWDIMGLYGRQWEPPVNLWNDLEICRLPQISVNAKDIFINRLSCSPQVEFQLYGWPGKKLILKFLLMYLLCSILNVAPPTSGPFNRPGMQNRLW